MLQAAIVEADGYAWARNLKRLLQQTCARVRAEREARAAKLRDSGGPNDLALADGLVMDAHDYLALALALARRRQAARMVWREFFRDWDIVIAPMALDVAFTHQTAEYHTRTLTVDNQTLPYFSNILFPMLAFFTGLPSNAFPAGLDSQGLPLGLQWSRTSRSRVYQKCSPDCLRATPWRSLPPPNGPISK